GSGTDAGGTGGGLSVVLNICAGLAVGTIATKSAKAIARRRPDPPTALPPRFIVMLFTENAANSSLVVAAPHPICLTCGAVSRLVWWLGMFSSLLPRNLHGNF